jgi:hypothetical protein
LTEWVRRIQTGATEEEFGESVRNDLVATGSDSATYERAMPFWQSYAGLTRYSERHGTAGSS